MRTSFRRAPRLDSSSRFRGGAPSISRLVGRSECGSAGYCARQPSSADEWVSGPGAAASERLVTRRGREEVRARASPAGRRASGTGPRGVRSAPRHGLDPRWCGSERGSCDRDGLVDKTATWPGRGAKPNGRAPASNVPTAPRILKTGSRRRATRIRSRSRTRGRVLGGALVPCGQDREGAARHAQRPARAGPTRGRSRDRPKLKQVLDLALCGDGMERRSEPTICVGSPAGGYKIVGPSLQFLPPRSARGGRIGQRRRARTGRSGPREGRGRSRATGSCCCPR
jgi:hypothetical protein